MGLLDAFSSFLGGGGSANNIPNQAQLYALANKQAAGGIDLNTAFADALKRYQAQNISGTDIAGNAPYMAAQNGLVQGLQQSASGQGPSVAEASLAANRDANIAAANAAAQSGVGNQNVGLLQQNVANQVGGINQNAANEANLARLQEIFAARSQLGNANQQGVGLNTAQAGVVTNDQAMQNQILAQAAQREQAQASLNSSEAGNEFGLQQGSEKAAGGLASALGASGASFMGFGTNSSPMGGGGKGSGGGGSTVNFGGTTNNNGGGGGGGGGEGGYAHGGMVGGKSKVSGDSPKNDTIHIKVSPGELVIPKSAVKAGPEAVHAFVDHLMKSSTPRTKKKSEDIGYGAVLKACYGGKY